MPVIEQKTTNKNKVDFDLNRLDKSKTTIFSKYPKDVTRNCNIPQINTAYIRNNVNTKDMIVPIFTSRKLDKIM